MLPPVPVTTQTLPDSRAIYRAPNRAAGACFSGTLPIMMAILDTDDRLNANQVSRRRRIRVILP
jgi:hypothetical protein